MDIFSEISLLKNLNPAQSQAVTAPLGHLLILAGAGSGKTRVLVHRIAWFIEQRLASAYSIVAVTFTNKASSEMRARLYSMLGHQAEGMWIGTFHGLSHKLLRLHYKEAALPESFQVIDSDDQLHLIRRIFKSLNINEERWEPKKAQHFINRKKDEGVRADQLPHPEGAYEQVMGDVYKYYEKACVENGVVDFGELLIKTYELLKDNPEILSHYQERFQHFLVDEFQDTNTIQYKWLSLLAGHALSITVVGDDDQSIYGWRGAKIENIYRFEKEFKDTQLIRLEQNYRSTSTILSAANALIGHNMSRMGKTLWTESGEGEPISLYAGFNEEDEALYVVRHIREWIEQGGALKEIGVLYRSNAQSRVLEEALVRAGIPYNIYGGLRFFERAEIKDALAYVRLAVNLQDNAAFDRIINTPPRGIGERSLEIIHHLAQLRNCSYWEASLYILENREGMSAKAFQGLQSFVNVIESLIDCAKHNSLSKLIEKTIEESGLLKFLREQKGEKAQNKAENLEELLSATSDFEAEMPDTEESAVLAFLAYTTLEGGDHNSNKLKNNKQDENAVQLMTLHSAKGLEFPFVFICGLEDGLFPHHFSRENPKSLEEERRLCYVGITRAMQRLTLTYAEKRRVFGRDEGRHISRFISEIPQHLLKEASRRVSVTVPRYGSMAVSQAMGYSIQDPSGDGFGLGQRVKHPKFGQGTVIDSEGAGERARVHVHFDACGSKWLALAYAKLEPA